MRFKLALIVLSGALLAAPLADSNAVAQARPDASLAAGDFGSMEGAVGKSFVSDRAVFVIEKSADGQALIVSARLHDGSEINRVTVRKTNPSGGLVAEYTPSGVVASVMRLPDGGLLLIQQKKKGVFGESWFYDEVAGFRKGGSYADRPAGVNTAYNVTFPPATTQRVAEAEAGYAAIKAQDEQRALEREMRERREEDAREARQQALYNTLKGQLAVATENERRSSAALQSTLSDMSARAAQQRQAASTPRTTSASPPQTFPAPSPQTPPRSAATPVRQASASSGGASASTAAACTEKTGEREIFGLIEFKREDALASLMETKTIGPIYDIQCTQPNASGVLKGWWKCTGKASTGLTVKVCPNTGPQSASRQ